MPKLKNNKLLLLQTLRDVVTEAMESANINPFFEEDVSKFLMDLKDKKRIRRLKEIRKELDIFIKELKP